MNNWVENVNYVNVKGKKADKGLTLETSVFFILYDG